MQFTNLLYIIVGIIVTVFIVLLVYILILTIKILRKIRSLIERLERTKKDLATAKSAAKVGFWTVLESIIGKIVEGGDNGGEED